MLSRIRRLFSLPILARFSSSIAEASPAIGRLNTPLGLLLAIAVALAIALAWFVAGAVNSTVGILSSVGLCGIAVALAFLASRSLRAALTRADDNERFLAENNRQLQTIRLLMEQRVAEQSEALERRLGQLQIAAEVGNIAATMRDEEILLSQAVQLIAARFGFYHVGLFLLDEAQEVLVLRAANSVGGKQMLARGYRLKAGQQEVVGGALLRAEPVGAAAVARQARIALDIGPEAVIFYTPDLPETRSEMALPLLVGGQLSGVLDIQSERETAFGAEDIPVLQFVADQIAVALDNIRRLAETQAVLDALRRAYGEASRRDWAGALRGKSELGYRAVQSGSSTAGQNTEIALAAGAWPSEVRRAQQSGVMVQLPEDPRTMTLPLKIREDILGGIRLHKPAGAGRWNEEEIGLMEALAGQLGVALESARLFEQTQRRAEQLITAAQVSRAAISISNPDELIVETVELICQRFDLYYAAIFLVDSAGQWAVLKHATGQAGRALLERKHRLEVGGQSMVGWAVAHRQARIALDVGKEAVRFANPFLPDTHSEMALPLIVGDTVLGALDVQSTQINAFSEADITVLQTMADQIAIALQNARLYAEQRETAERLREVDKLKSQFLANMSHELRTPLNSIIGFSRVILKGIDGPISDLQQQDLNAIYSSGQHLLSMITDILDLSKIEAGKMEILIEEVNLKELIHSVTSTARGLVKDKPIELRFVIPEDLPNVQADATRVRQVMINLLSNAAKFTEFGTITVAACVQSSPQGSPEIQISVADSGIGIAPEDQAKLFEPFSQVDASPTRKTGGTGLGLSICRALVEMHGGRIGVSSQVGRGSTFYFTLPLPQAAAPETGAPQPSAPPKTVLAIEDNPQMTSLYERYLKNHGFEVVALHDPSEAVAEAAQLRPFAIILDVMMPGRDGWQVLKELKDAALTREIPVILCTILEEKEKGFRLGAAEYLTKPLLEEELVQALQRLGA